MGYIIGAVVGLIVGVWLIVSAFHIALTIIGWLIVVAAAASLIMYFMRGRSGRSPAARA
jgi:uncharacterized membrane protein HdeD (DUF308 family)